MEPLGCDSLWIEDTGFRIRDMGYPITVAHIATSQPLGSVGPCPKQQINPALFGTGCNVHGGAGRCSHTEKSPQRLHIKRLKALFNVSRGFQPCCIVEMST
jgi:hypothetical protein